MAFPRTPIDSEIPKLKSPYLVPLPYIYTKISHGMFSQPGGKHNSSKALNQNPINHAPISSAAQAINKHLNEYHPIDNNVSF